MTAATAAGGGEAVERPAPATDMNSHKILQICVWRCWNAGTYRIPFMVFTAGLLQSFGLDCGENVPTVLY